MIDKETAHVYKDEVLDYCSYCKQTLFDGIYTTEDFHELLDKSNLETGDVQVDIFGYVKGKERISRAYRKSQNFTCEDCGVSSKDTMHNRFWHTHHVDGDKTHNNYSNLKCLCILCHSHQDSQHEINFQTKKMKLQIQSFISKYKDELESVNNPYMHS